MIALLMLATLSGQPSLPETGTAAAHQAELDRRARENAEVVRLAELSEHEESSEAESAPSLAGVMLKMFAVLAGICLLAYFTLGKMLPKLLRVPTPTGANRVLEVVDRLPLDQRRSVIVIAVGEETPVTIVSKLISKSPVPCVEKLN